MACTMPLLAPMSAVASERRERRVGSGHQVSRGVDALDRVAEQDLAAVAVMRF